MVWQLWRQDDNGNRFLVGEFATRELAESRMAELSSGHHRQIYWIIQNGERRQGASGGER